MRKGSVVLSVLERRDSWKYWGALIPTTIGHHFGVPKRCCSQLLLFPVIWCLWLHMLLLFYCYLSAALSGSRDKHHFKLYNTPLKVDNTLQSTLCAVAIHLSDLL